MMKIILSAAATAFLLSAGVMTVSTFNAAPAAAQNNAKVIVDGAIAQGVVGETAGGYLMVVSGASPEIANAVREINIGRKTVYTRLAREQNVSVDVIAALTGEKQIAKSPQGSKIMTPDGRWMTK